jgi:penicillin-binding protein 2
VTTTFRPRRPPGRLGGGGGGGWAPALTPRIAVRIAILGGIAMTLLGILLVRLWFLQVIAGEQYAQRAEGNRLRTVISEAPRGNIVDRNGTALVKNFQGENLIAQPRELQGTRRVAILTRLSKVIDVPAKDLVKEVANGDDQPLEPVILARNVDPAVSQYLAERRRDFPGIALRKTYLRYYPQGSMAAHILGQTGRIGPEEIDAYRRKGYQGDETVGKSGIEAQY